MIRVPFFPSLNWNPFKDFDSHEKRLNFSLKGIFVFLLLIVLQSLSIAFANPNFQIRGTMKVHPMPKKRNNVTIQYYSGAGGGSNRRDGSNKKLRRLPHIFSRVLELPFRSDADVSVEESHDCFRFVAETDNVGEVRAHAIEIYPGVVKIVIRPIGYLELLSLDDLELDMWRFRLPESTRPELASAVLADGELIVTVPKGGEVEDGNENNGNFRGGMGNNNNNNARLVLVQ